MSFSARPSITILNAVSLAANTLASSVVFSNGSVTALNTGSTASDNSLSSNWFKLNLELTVTNGTTSPNPSKQIRVYYAFSENGSISTTSLPTAFTNVGYFDLLTSGTASAAKASSSGEIPVTADYLYTWLAVFDPLPVAVTVSLTANQVF